MPVSDDHERQKDLLDTFCEGGEPKNFLRACLLLLLRERSSHGYDLIERLRANGVDRVPGSVYRALRALELEGLLRSVWTSSRAGPVRREYELTPDGEEVLSNWAQTLEATRAMLNQFLQRYSTAKETGSRPANHSTIIMNGHIAEQTDLSELMCRGQDTRARCVCSNSRTSATSPSSVRRVLRKPR